MKTQEILEKMKILNGVANRRILKLLLRGPKDFAALRRESKMSRSVIFESLGTLRKAGIIERKKLQDKSRGRPAYEYSVRSFYLPELTKKNLLDFLIGMDLNVKSYGLIDLSVLDDLIEKLSVPIEFILYLMISSGFKFNHAFQILIDLLPDLRSETEFKEIIGRIIEIAENRYPIDSIVLEIFRERSAKEIYIKSENDKKTLTLNYLKNTVLSELQIGDFEADYVAQKTWMTLVIMGIYEIEYPSLVNLLYTLAENIGIVCERLPYSYKVLNLPSFKESGSILFVESSGKEARPKDVLWSWKEISKYMERKMNLDRSKCDFLANITVEKLYTLGMKKYTTEFLDSLIEELIRELNI